MRLFGLLITVGLIFSVACYAPSAFAQRDGGPIRIQTVKAIPHTFGYLNSVAFSPDGTALMVGYEITIGGEGNDKPLIFRYKNGEIEEIDTSGLPSDARLNSVAFALDGSALIVGSEGDFAAVYEYSAGIVRPIDIAVENVPGLESVAFGPEEVALITGRATFGPDVNSSDDDYSTILTYDGVSILPVDTSYAQSQDNWVEVPSFTSVAFSPTGKALMVGRGVLGREASTSLGFLVTPPHNPAIWKYENGALSKIDTSHLISLREWVFIESVEFSRDGSALLVGEVLPNVVFFSDENLQERYGDALVLRYDRQVLNTVDTSQVMANYPGDAVFHLNDVAFTPDGDALIVGYSDSGGEFQALVWRYENGALTIVDTSELVILNGSSRVESVAYSPDGGTAIAVGHYTSSTPHPLIIVFGPTSLTGGLILLVILVSSIIVAGLVVYKRWKPGSAGATANAFIVQLPVLTHYDTHQHGYRS